MGCDIHGVVEIFHQGEWKMAMNISDLSPRDYRLFALLFGVRGTSPYNFGRRGFPVNRAWSTGYIFCEECSGNGHPQAVSKEKLAEYTTKYNEGKECEDCGDWHSVSYITMQEIEAEHRWREIDQCIGSEAYLQEWRVVFDTMRFWSEYLKEENVVIESVATLATGKEDTSRVRLVVWFDN